MAFKIIFTYNDGGKIVVSNSRQKLTKEIAAHYQKQYAKPSNDGGMVYISPYKNCVPIPLNDFIEKCRKV